VGSGDSGDLQDSCHYFLGPLLRLRLCRVLREKLPTELVVPQLVGLDVLAVNAHGLGVATLVAVGHEVLVDRIGDRLQHEKPGGEALDRGRKAA